MEENEYDDDDDDSIIRCDDNNDYNNSYDFDQISMTVLGLYILLFRSLYSAAHLCNTRSFKALAVKVFTLLFFFVAFELSLHHLTN